MNELERLNRLLGAASTRSALGWAGPEYEKLYGVLRANDRTWGAGGAAEQLFGTRLGSIPSHRLEEIVGKVGLDLARTKVWDGLKLAGLGADKIGSLAANTRLDGSASMFGRPDLAAMIGESSLSKVRSLSFAEEQFASLSRVGHWAGGIGGLKSKEMERLLGVGRAPLDQLGQLTQIAHGLGRFSSTFGSESAFASGAIARLADTTKKMALFAGAIDVFGPSARTSDAAFSALLGEYNSIDTRKTSLLRDVRDRAKFYRDAGVDEGLIEADTASTIEVMVEGGVAVGTVSRSGWVAASIEMSGLSLRISAAQPKAGAYRLINLLEANLRQLVERRLREVVEAKDGSDAATNWFVRRVPGEIVKNAKGRRRDALRGGEQHRSLVQFTELGDLLQIIVRSDNWNDAFQQIFERAEPLKVDIERLIAIRRPTMHGRSVDPVMLTEAILVVRRLRSAVDRAASSDSGWDDDV